MQFYEKLSKETENKIRQEKADNSFWNFGFDEEKVIRRDETRDKASIWRTAFIRDIDKIMHCPYYNRYADKTQVFSNSFFIFILLQHICHFLYLCNKVCYQATASI